MFPFETIFFGMIFIADRSYAATQLKVIYDDISSHGNTLRRNDKSFKRISIIFKNHLLFEKQKFLLC